MYGIGHNGGVQETHTGFHFEFHSFNLAIQQLNLFNGLGYLYGYGTAAGATDFCARTLNLIEISTHEQTAQAHLVNK